MLFYLNYNFCAYLHNYKFNNKKFYVTMKIFLITVLLTCAMSVYINEKAMEAMLDWGNIPEHYRNLQATGDTGPAIDLNAE